MIRRCRNLQHGMERAAAARSSQRYGGTKCLSVSIGLPTSVGEIGSSIADAHPNYISSRRPNTRCFTQASISVSSKQMMTDDSVATIMVDLESTSGADEIEHEHVRTLIEDLDVAATWAPLHKGDETLPTSWDPMFCRKTVDRYDLLLQEMVSGIPTSQRGKSSSNDASPTAPSLTESEKQLLLSADTVILALKALLRSKFEPDELSKRVRSWERALGQLKMTTLTDHLSLRLLTANAKSGNVGRVLQLLQLRKARGYRPREREFLFAVNSILAAGWSQLGRNRNVFVADTEQPAIDNPTRWLDAILLNMHERDFPVTSAMANRMILCYSAGKTGKAVHHFYRVKRQPVQAMPEDERPEDTSKMPQDWFFVEQSGYSYQPMKIKLAFNRESPPYFKVPSQAKDKLLFSPDSKDGKFRLEVESQLNYSVPLAAAFAFAESLQHGACGHAGVELNTESYNALIKACVERGALWRAMHVLNEAMPAAGCQPDDVSFNLVLAGLARVGDVSTTQEYYRKMLNLGVAPNQFTVRAVVDGLLNLGDVPGAITVTQDFFNQHSILPPSTTHLKILEFCLARDMVYEAKRYLYFIQQLWHWEANEYHSEKFIRSMRSVQRNPQLQREALEELFAYFGETLEDSDFIRAR